MSVDLTSVIEDAITDAELPADPLPEVGESSDADSGYEAAPSDDAPSEVSPAEDTSSEVSSAVEMTSRAAEQTSGAESKSEDFDSKFGLEPKGSGGRENRIPYSRVRKIVENARSEAVAPLAQQVQEFQAKLQDYEGRLSQVGQFEEVLQNRPQEFLELLSQVPTYQPFFEQLGRLSQVAQYLEQQQMMQDLPQADPASDMPQPDQIMPDGSRVYSMDGLRELLGWQAQQVREQVTQEVSQRYAPIEQQWYEAQQQAQYEQQVQEHIAQLVPQVQAQIDEARQWPMFQENEAAITKALQQNTSLSLEGAYRQVVLPRLTSGRESMRQQLLQEMKQAPRSTSAPTGFTRQNPEPQGPQSLEDIIRQQIQQLR